MPHLQPLAAAWGTGPTICPGIGRRIHSLDNGLSLGRHTVWRWRPRPLPSLAGSFGRRWRRHRRRRRAKRASNSGTRCRGPAGLCSNLHLLFFHRWGYRAKSSGTTPKDIVQELVTRMRQELTGFRPQPSSHSIYCEDFARNAFSGTLLRSIVCCNPSAYCQDGSGIPHRSAPAIATTAFRYGEPLAGARPCTQGMRQSPRRPADSIVSTIPAINLKMSTSEMSP